MTKVITTSIINAEAEKVYEHIIDNMPRGTIAKIVTKALLNHDGKDNYTLNEVREKLNEIESEIENLKSSHERLKRREKELLDQQEMFEKKKEDQKKAEEEAKSREEEERILQKKNQYNYFYSMIKETTNCQNDEIIKEIVMERMENNKRIDEVLALKGFSFDKKKLDYFIETYHTRKKEENIDKKIDLERLSSDIKTRNESIYFYEEAIRACTTLTNEVNIFNIAVDVVDNKKSLEDVLGLNGVNLDIKKFNEFVKNWEIRQQQEKEVVR